MRLPSLLGNPQLKAVAAGMPQSPGTPILLAGPWGSGKRTCAMDLAAGLLCRSRGDRAPCGVCPACIRMQAGSHPDFHELTYEGKAVKIDQVRELRARTFLKSQEAEFKVFVIHAADRLSPACQNALLKVLEEPQHCAFILLCESREALLQTIRSRCVTYTLAPLDRAVLAERLGGLGDAAQIEAAIAASDGYLGQALAALEGEFPAWQQLARDFTSALSGSELDIYRACLAAGKLGRDEYDQFLGGVAERLTDLVKRTGDPRYISIYDYIGEQQTYRVQNPSLTALVSALAAYCGQAMGR